MDLGKKIRSILAGAMALGSVGCATLNVEKVADLTGDGIPDVIVDDYDISFSNGRYLFIGKKDGSFVKAREYQNPGKGGTRYFITDDGTIYFPRGNNYEKAEKEK